MTYIDVAIPGLIGLLLLLRPQTVFLGSRAVPNAKKLRLLRTLGALLLLIAALYQGIRLAGA